MEAEERCDWRNDSGQCEKEADCTVLDQNDKPVIALCEEHYKMWFARMHCEYTREDDE